MLLNRWGGSAANWLKDWSGNGYNFSLNGTVTETAGGFLLSKTTPTHRIFQGSTDFLRRITNLHPRTNNFYFGVGLKTPASLSGFKVLGNARTAAQGHSVHTFNDTLGGTILDGSVGLTGKVGVSTNTFYYATWRFRRDGNVTCLVFGPTGLLTDTTDISSYSAVDINNASDYFIGTYAPIVTNSEWDGGLVFYKYIKDDTLTDKQIYEDFFLPTGWTTRNGLLYRHASGSNTFGWHLSIQNTGAAAPTIGLVGGASGAPTGFTGDSTLCTLQLPTVTSLSGDTLYIATPDDTALVALPDTTFTANRGLQITIDLWSVARLTAPVAQYLIADNATITTYALAPEISVNPESYNYGDITVSDSDSVYIKIINTGDGSLSVTDINWITAAQVAVNDTDFTITANDSDSVLVYFKPQAAGSLVDTLTIVNDDADESNKEVPLAATGIAAATTTVVTNKNSLDRLNKLQGSSKF
jgi:hypothetical protein